MKTLLFLSAILSINILSAQTWAAQTQTNGAHTDHRTGVHFVSESEGWCCGTSSDYMLHTINSGVEWNVQPTATQPLNSVFFINASLGWAVGFGNYIISTNNGGVTWTTQTSPLPLIEGNFNKVYFVSATKGWIGGNGCLLTTSDGGLTWTKMSGFPVSASYPNIIDMQFVNSNTGWIVDERNFLVTHDGGLTFSVGAGSCAPFNNTKAIYALNALQIWSGGTSGCLLYSNNGGSSATYISTSTPKTLGCIRFINSTNGWFSTPDGEIKNTTDGGFSWDSQLTVSYLNHMFFTGTRGWAVGDNIYSISGFPVGIKELDNEKEVIVYPNPADNYINISGINISNIIIENELGQTIKSIVLKYNTNENSINISELNNGIYFMKLKIDNQIIVKKIIKN